MNPDNNNPTDNTSIPPVEPPTTDPVTSSEDTVVAASPVLPSAPATESSTPQPDVVSPGAPSPSPDVNADADMASEDTTTLGDLAQNLESTPAAEPAAGPSEGVTEPSSEAAPSEPSNDSEQTPSA